MEAKEKNRKQYKRPQVTHVNLEIREAVLSACKSAQGDTAGKNTSGCNIAKCQYQPYGS
jgi:hypothetical protein